MSSGTNELAMRAKERAEKRMAYYPKIAGLKQLKMGTKVQGVLVSLLIPLHRSFIYFLTSKLMGKCKFLCPKIADFAKIGLFRTTV